MNTQVFFQSIYLRRIATIRPTLEAAEVHREQVEALLEKSAEDPFLDNPQKDRIRMLLMSVRESAKRTPKDKVRVIQHLVIPTVETMIR